MKKNVQLTAIFVLLTTFSFAQFSKGQKVLNGNFNFGLNSSKDTAAKTESNSFNILISPSVGKFISSNEIVEFGFFISHSSNKTIQTSTNIESKTKGYGIGLNYTRTKLYPIVGKLNFTLGIGAIVNFGTSKSTVSNSNSYSQNTSYSAAIGISPGLLFPLSKKVLLRTNFSNLGAISFTHQRNKFYNTGSSNTTSSNNLNLGAGGVGISANGLNIGVSLLL